MLDFLKSRKDGLERPPASSNANILQNQNQATLIKTRKPKPPPQDSPTTGFSWAHLFFHYTVRHLIQDPVQVPLSSNVYRLAVDKGEGLSDLLKLRSSRRPCRQDRAVATEGKGVPGGVPSGHREGQGARRANGRQTGSLALGWGKLLGRAGQEGERE